jgi:hypothetical protein
MTLAATFSLQAGDEGYGRVGPQDWWGRGLV